MDERLESVNLMKAIPQLNRSLSSKTWPDYPVKAIQFGGGVFLRGFFDWMVDVMNRQGLFQGSVALVQSINRERAGKLNRQDGLYTLRLRGLAGQEYRDEEQIIPVIRQWLNPKEQFAAFLELAENPDLRLIVSNTTEAGITWQDECAGADQPAMSFPARLTQLLYRRYTFYQGSAQHGVVILPCELIDGNGELLRQYILRHALEWGLPADFGRWLKDCCPIPNTLVDRIVSGYPQEEIEAISRRLGYRDELYNTAEYYHLWVIESAPLKDLPFRQAGLNIVYTAQLAPYRELKLRILNGLHSLLTAPSLLCGLKTVAETLQDPDLNRFMRQSLDQAILPYVPIDSKTARSYADSVLSRFANPALSHSWSAIALHAAAKFRVRVLPSMADAVKAGHDLLPHMALALAALIMLYRENNIAEPEPPETKQAFRYFWQQADLAADPDACRQAMGFLLADTTIWGYNLNQLTGLSQLVSGQLAAIRQLGIRKVVQHLVRQT